MLHISSPVFANNKLIPSVYSCDGTGVNPPLVFTEVPENTKSLVLIVDDPDAPMGTFVHWVVYNISPTVREIVANSVPENAQQANTSIGRPGYVAPCPPSGNHRYLFKVYALGNTLPVGLPDKPAVEKAMERHVLASSQLIGLYQRK